MAKLNSPSSTSVNQKTVHLNKNLNNFIIHTSSFFFSATTLLSSFFTTGMVSTFGFMPVFVFGTAGCLYSGAGVVYPPVSEKWLLTGALGCGMAFAL